MTTFDQPAPPHASTRTAAARLVDAGHQLSRSGRIGEAEVAYRRAIDLAPGLAMAHNNLGWVLGAQGDDHAAVTCYQRALELDPNLRIARRNLAVLLVQLGRPEESRSLFHAEMSRGAGAVEWMDGLISRAMEARDLCLAGVYAELFAGIRWASAWPAARRGGSSEPLEPVMPNVFLTVPKLFHDIEQFVYLQEHGVFGDELTPIIAAYQRTADRVAPLGPDARVPLDGAAQDAIGHVYSRLLHVRDTPRADRALSHRWDAAAVEAEYLDRPPGVVVVDDFLSDAALESLRAFCLESTVWSANRYNHGRLGAFFREGFNCPLLLQIAEELRAALPRVIGDRYPLRQMWGFKNGHTVPPDASIHADFAAVNVNFWITPDDANLDERTGGFLVYEVDAPPDWDFATYNGRPDVIRSYLRQHDARRVTIPYRANRAVIFNSDLFHETAEVRFRPGYENRRINITMLYGHREVDVHHRQPHRPDLDRPAGSTGWRSAAFARTRAR